MKKNEKYSERFCNKENEVTSGIFNSENWGKRTKVMTLRDKFKKCKDASSTYYILPIADDAEQLEQIADDYAIEFAEWVEKLRSSEIDTIDYDLYLRYNTKELLEIFKKEKGL